MVNGNIHQLFPFCPRTSSAILLVTVLWCIYYLNFKPFLLKDGHIIYIIIYHLYRKKETTIDTSRPWPVQGTWCVNQNQLCCTVEGLLVITLCLYLYRFFPTDKFCLFLVVIILIPDLLLQALVFADANGIKENCVKLGAGDDLYPLFAGILTMRPWERVIDPAVDHLVMRGSDGDHSELQVIVN